MNTVKDLVSSKFNQKIISEDHINTIKLKLNNEKNIKKFKNLSNEIFRKAAI